MRKRIEDLNCLAANVILATCFDWRELANRLTTAGKKVPHAEKSQLAVPEVIYRMAHTACHGDPGFAESLTESLNRRFQKEIQAVEQMDPKALCSCFHPISLEHPRLAGLLWALATDLREAAQKVLNVFLHMSVTHLFRICVRPDREEVESLANLGRLNL